MMLKPFQVRDLHGSSSGGPEEVSPRPSNLHGVMQVSAADYDNITLNHPRARLTYLDDDDGDQITARPNPTSFLLSNQAANSFM